MIHIIIHSIWFHSSVFIRSKQINRITNYFPLRDLSFIQKATLTSKTNTMEDWGMFIAIITVIQTFYWHVKSLATASKYDANSGAILKLSHHALYNNRISLRILQIITH